MMNKILDINERILYIIDNQYNGNQKKFAERIGFAAQVVFNIVSGRKSKPSYDVLFAIISTNDYISSEWLLMGYGEMQKKDGKEELSDNKGDIIDQLRSENSLLKENNELLKFKIATLEQRLSQEKSVTVLRSTITK